VPPALQEELLYQSLQQALIAFASQLQALIAFEQPQLRPRDRLGGGWWPPQPRGCIPNGTVTK
jgi:hypothetical protein